MRLGGLHHEAAVVPAEVRIAHGIAGGRSIEYSQMRSASPPHPPASSSSLSGLPVDDREIAGRRARVFAKTGATVMQKWPIDWVD
jgi:hypothetical protein